jgi:hypothetical protein
LEIGSLRRATQARAAKVSRQRVGMVWIEVGTDHIKCRFLMLFYVTHDALVCIRKQLVTSVNLL